MIRRTHKQALEAVRKLCSALGGRCYVTAQSARLRGSAGIPDCYCILPRIAIWVEVKVGADTLSPEQRAFKAAAERFTPVVVGDVEDVMRFLRTL